MVQPVDMVSVRRTDWEEIVASLKLSRDFFERRDEMNAAVHSADTRYSPITEKAQRALYLAKNVSGNAS